jgi:hypothetical protein
MSNRTIPVDTINTRAGLSVVGGLTSANNYMLFGANSTQPTIAASTTGPLVFNSTPLERTGFPEFATTQWSNNTSQWTPGRAGLYLLVWSLHSGNNACESFIVKNNPSTGTTQTAFGTSSMIALAYGLENTATAVFYSKNSTDFVSFGIYNGASGSLSANGPRNYLTIYRLF